MRVCRRERDAHVDMTAAAARLDRSDGVDGPALALPDLEPALVREADVLIGRLEDAERTALRAD